MTRDLNIVTVDSYGHASGHLEEIGRMTGGWIKSASGAAT